MKCDKYIGCDLHQATTVVAVLDAEGKVVMETIVATEAAAMIRFLKSLSGPLHITFEETTQARWMYDVVRGYVSEAIVCDPRRNKLLGEGSKADTNLCFVPVAEALSRTVSDSYRRVISGIREQHVPIHEIQTCRRALKSDR